MEEKNIDLHDYFRIVRKNKIPIAVIFSSLFFISVIIAISLPAIYKSSATILIEQQEIPRELVMSTVTSYASERIQTIQAQVMSRSNLFKIMDKFNLYEKKRKYKTSEEIVAQMRDDFDLEIISADVVDPRTGRPSAATIAFSLSYKGESPAVVQRVASEFVQLYLNMNLQNRTAKAEETSAFFKEELVRSGKEISDLANELAVFKEENSSMLPELQMVNMRVLQRAESDIANINAKLRVLEETKYYLEGELEQINPDNPLVYSVSSRLKVLEADYIAAISRYSESHPNVIRLKSEIESLKADRKGKDDFDSAAAELKQLRSKLTVLSDKYTPVHPDIVSVKSKIKQLEEKLESGANANVEESYYQSKPDNPAFITLKARLDNSISEISSLKDEKKRLVEKMRELEDDMMKAPQVEREYHELQRSYKSALLRNQEIQSKKMSADIAKQLEAESKGERFTLIDPPAIPDLPISPNRPAIVIIGFIFALGGGFGFAFAANFIGKPIGGAKSIDSLIGAPPLAVVPYIMNVSDVVKRNKYKKRFLFAAIFFVVFVFIFVHIFVSPLDVLWYRLLRKAEYVVN
ncbi:MAG: Wzz/FepE/Etk N-terminal domain-containing protein [Gammaproteobacteria bacterium]|nr:Wzz/FepE/Etk N-terminal domain-containing protein [Gammaproteobacteria bacterium]MCW8923421.1 Wzz/FepE/Etk N-terminal domain-containing protein [Gammaproteobacteria bacterium]